MKKICIIDYGLGNVASIYNAVEYLDRNVKLSRNPDDIKKATHLILPGVGSYKTGMDNLFKYDLVEILNSQVITKKKPFLGICLGMQLLSTSSTEGGPQKGLNWINGEVGEQSEDDFHRGTEVTTANSTDWSSDDHNLHGGSPKIIWDALTGSEARFRIKGPLNISGSSLNITT